MAENLDKGMFGEQGAGFFLGAQGYYLFEGPGGKGGHAANAPDFDGVAYSIKSDDLILYDNKMFKSDRNIGSGTAIDPAVNLVQNLDGLIARVQNARDLPARYRILELLLMTRITVTKTGVRSPPNVRIAITNFGGNSRGVTKALAERGIKFIDMNSAPAVPKRPSRIYINDQTIPALAQPAVAAYDARRALVGASAEVTRFAAQGANDLSLKYAINGELKRLAAPIGEAIVRGGGALVVVNINAMSPPGNVGMVIARSISSAYVVAHPNSNMQEAVMLWKRSGNCNKQRPAHVTLETQLFWIAASNK